MALGGAKMQRQYLLFTSCLAWDYIIISRRLAFAFILWPTEEEKKMLTAAFHKVFSAESELHGMLRDVMWKEGSMVK